MKLLALRLCDHDSNLSYFDGTDIFYHKTERTTQVKHHGYQNLWQWRQTVKNLWNLNLEDIDEIAIVIDPWLNKLPTDSERFLSKEYDLFPAPCKVWRINHHYAHSLSAWMLLEREPDVSFVFDGFGDMDNSWTILKGEKIVEKGSVKNNGSLGVSIIKMGIDLGIDASSSLDIAGKMMGLQSFGKINSKFLEELNQFNISTNKEFFNFKHWENFVGDKIIANLTKLDWARTVHERIGDALLEHFKKFAKKDDLIVYAGGVAQNVIWNTKLKNYFTNMVIPPHCADDGLSLGALEWLRRKNNLSRFSIANFPYCQTDEKSKDLICDDNIKKTAKYLAEGKVVAWYQNNGEIGPRALGNRSIFMDPRILQGKIRINQIKKREPYRPFGASVLIEHKDLFHLNYDNPVMLYVGHSDKEKFPAITHIDNTCRVQTVSNDCEHLYKLLKYFFELTGCPALLNTSLNLAGKPIAGNIKDAREFYRTTSIDAMFIGDEELHR